MRSNLKFGLVLPHFGEYASIDRCIEGATRAEIHGFDSVWVRDHIAFVPHDLEGSDNTHIEGLITLSAVAAATKKINVGTAMAICHRHPLHLAQSFAALSNISNGRVIMGLGLGGFPHEFQLRGPQSELLERAQLAKTNAMLCRRLWAGEKISYHDQYYNFTEVELKPTPVQAIPIWCGGSSPAACRRVAEFGQGWLPARITLATFRKRIAYLRERLQEAGRALVPIGVVPLTSIATDKENALRQVNIKALLDEANRNRSWVKPPSGTFSTLADLEGLILAGTTEDIIRETRAYRSAGADLVVFDLRFRFANWQEQVDLLGREVLPALRDN